MNWMWTQSIQVYQRLRFSALIDWMIKYWLFNLQTPVSQGHEALYINKYAMNIKTTYACM